MNYSIINTCDTANGEGIRVSLFVSGCGHHCPGCFSSQTWDPQFGQKFTDKTLKYIFQNLKPDYIDGLSLLGGDPLYKDNLASILSIVESVKKEYPTKNTWLWTGYTMEEIQEEIDLWHQDELILKQIIDNIDVLVDGRFEEDKKDLTLKFRGSSNQRIWVKKDGVWSIEE